MMIEAYLERMRLYGKFDGRTSRRDYWMYLLIFVGLMVLATILDAIFGTETKAGGVFMGLVWVAHLAPNLAMAAERLHDQDRTAWWLLLLLTGVGGIVKLIFMALPGTLGDNRFGAAPVGSTGALASNQFRQHPVSSAAGHPMPNNITDELERLAQLRASGSLTDAEFDMMKSRLLASAR